MEKMKNIQTYDSQEKAVGDLFAELAEMDEMSVQFNNRQENAVSFVQGGVLSIICC